MSKRNKMRIILIFPAVVFLFPLFSTSAEELNISAGISWDLSLKGGIRYMITPAFGIKADMGISLFSMEGDAAFTYDLFFVAKQNITGTPFGLGVYIGIPTGYFVFTSPFSIMNAFRLSLFTDYRLTNTVNLSLRAGGGYPLFFTDNSWGFKQTRFPLGIWPDLGLEAYFKL